MPNVDAIATENYTLLVRADQQKILRYWTKYAFFSRIISVVGTRFS